MNRNVKIMEEVKCKYYLPCGKCDYRIQINAKNTMCNQYLSISIKEKKNDIRTDDFASVNRERT